MYFPLSKGGWMYLQCKAIKNEKYSSGWVTQRLHSVFTLLIRTIMVSNGNERGEKHLFPHEYLHSLFTQAVQDHVTYQETYKELFHSPLHYSYSIQHFHSHTSTLRSYFQRVYLFLFKVHQISEESPLLTWVTSSKSDVHGCFFCLFCWHFQILTFLWLHFNHLICQDEVCDWYLESKM